jgi:hypothetical protein
MRDWRAKEEPSRAQDIADLERLVGANSALLEKLTDKEVEAFADMLYTVRLHKPMLTEKQRAWVKEKLNSLDVPQYENLISRGLVDGKSKVETIPALRRENLPMKPPPKRKRDDG